jgi:hypothetical protein
LYAAVAQKELLGNRQRSWVIVVQFENIDKLNGFIQSSAFKESQAVGDKYADNIRIFGVEGVAK